MLCLGIAGLVAVVGPTGLPGFSQALVAVFSLLALVFLALGVLGAVLVAVFGE
ncbi:hypothetical protein [Haloarcula marina]|uniref:hypothetical protein n=1 Tax=Haloarcula marina TaxID=2961574 RepID=UPI003D68A678